MRRILACGGAVLVLAGMAGAVRAQDVDDVFTRPYWLDRSVIEAVGRAQVEAAPNRASFSVTFLETAREAKDAAAEAADRARLAAEAVRQRGGERVEMRSSVSLQPMYDQYQDRQGQQLSSTRDDDIEGYAARVTLQIELSDVMRAGDARAAALAVGPENASDLYYTLENTIAAQREVFVLAAEDAAARARASARAVGANLGPLLVLQEGQGPCLGGWGYGSRGYGAPPPPPPPPPAAAAYAPVTVAGARGQELSLSAEDIARLSLPNDPQTITLDAAVCAVYAVAP